MTERALDEIRKARRVARQNAGWAGGKMIDLSSSIEEAFCSRIHTHYRLGDPRPRLGI